MNKLKYEIKPTSTASKAYPDLRFKLEQTIFNQVYKETKKTDCDDNVFRQFLELEIDNLQEEINDLLNKNNRDMSSKEYQEAHKVIFDKSSASLVALELYAELA